MDQLSPWVGIAGLTVTVFIAALGLAFHLGRLSQRVTQVETAGAETTGRHDAVVRLEVEMTHVVEKLDSLDRGVTDMNRQLVSIATGGLVMGTSKPPRHRPESQAD